MRHEPLGKDRASAGLSLVDGATIAWVVAALLNTVVLAVTAPAWKDGLGAGATVLLHVYDVGQSLTVGAMLALGAAALGRWRSRPRHLGWLIASALSAAVGVLLLQDDLQRPASRLMGGHDSEAMLFGACAMTGLGVPAAALCARLLARPWWRWLPLLGGAALGVANHFVLEGDYPDAHLLFGTTAAVVSSAALIGTRVRLGRRTTGIALGVAACLALFAALVPPPNAIRVRLGRTWSAALVKGLPRTAITRWQRSKGHAGSTVYHPGLDGRPIPPSDVPLVPDDAIVIYFSADSLRADLLEDEAQTKRFKNFRKLRDAGTWFTMARSPGTQTAVTLTSVTTGTYFSQQYWTRTFIPEGKGVRSLMPAKDTSVRFPELLAKAGVPTVRYAQAVWLLNEYGMTRGFTEERFVEPRKGKWSTGDELMKVILKRLEKHGKGPLFLFLHDLDPHSPFDLGRQRRGSRKSRWLSEVDLVDRRLGTLRRVLARTGLAERTVIIFTADHGEAFREHGTSFHGQNLYDEQVRVPLVIYVPGLPPQKVDEAVTLVDLGPTILDLFRLSTPTQFLGQSLVPFLQGKRPKLERPIIAEGRLKQSMVLPEGLKLIRDQREGTFEIYDLAKDPKEKDNLYDDMGERGDKLMQRLEAFFAEHEIARPGYEVPFRR